jgi:hypothetical protein
LSSSQTRRETRAGNGFPRRRRSLAYGEATGEKAATSITLGSILAVLPVAIGASLFKKRRAATTTPSKR